MLWSDILKMSNHSRLFFNLNSYIYTMNGINFGKYQFSE